MSQSTHRQRSADAPDLPDDPVKFVFHFINQFRGWYLLIFFLEVIGTVSSTFKPVTFARIVKSIVQLHTTPQLIWSALTVPLVTFSALSLGEVVFQRLAWICRARTNPRMRRSVTQDLYGYLQRHSHRFITNNFAGSLAHRISETSQGVERALNTTLFEFVPVVLRLLIVTVLLTYTSVTLGLFIALWSAIFLYFSQKLAQQCRPHSRKYAAARSESSGRIVDSVTNLSSVRLFARLFHEREDLKKYLDKEIATSRVAMDYMFRIHWFQNLASLVLQIGILLLAAFLVRYERIGIVGFVMSITLANLIIADLRNLSRHFTEFFEHIGNIANGVNVLIRPHEVIDAPEAKPLVVGRGAIEFRNITFGYTPDKNVFENLNLSISPGERVGLVGYSGSGKSTLVNLVLRLYEPQSGSILIDGTDIRKVTQASLHEQISLIPQEPGLFHRSLMENIRYGNLQANDREIEEAASLAHAHDFISKMPSAYSSLVGERGVKLSGGQRQRVAIARVIAKGAPILIMDEATSSLDSVTEKAIQDSLDVIMRSKTVIVVAHRLSTIAHLDRIVVFDQGRIVEDGSHSALLSRNGMYAKLWNRQVNGFIPESSELAA